MMEPRFEGIVRERNARLDRIVGRRKWRVALPIERMDGTIRPLHSRAMSRSVAQRAANRLEDDSGRKTYLEWFWRERWRRDKRAVMP